MRNHLPFIRHLCSLFLLTCVGPLATAQEATRTRSADSTESVTRADLGLAYLRLERAYFSNLPVEIDRVRQINQAFDAATKNFFSGKLAETIQEVNQVTAPLIAKSPSESIAVAMSLKPTISPAVVHLDNLQTIRIQLSSIYKVDSATDQSLQLSLRPIHGGDAVITAPIAIDDKGIGYINATVELVPNKKLVAGLYSVVVSNGNELGVAIGQLNVVSGSLDLMRQENETKLAALSANHPELVSAIGACRSRNELLDDNPSAKDSSQFLSDLSELASQVADEIEMISAGTDPFRRRVGDYWRTFAASEKDKVVPCRIYAPESIIGDKPVPLVIALHGAGGDENMFFEGYGAGLIKRLADEHGFLVASPATTVIGGRIERFDALVEQLSKDYAIDSSSIYLIGHSMGGFTTTSIASKRSSKLAAACCLAGGGNPGSKELPPMLVVGAELDAIVPNGFLKMSAQQAIDAGLPVQFQLKENYGHTLMVGAMLPQAVDWLLKHRIGEQSPPSE